MGEHQRIVVGVHDAGVGRDPLRDLVGVVLGRQAGAHVEELPDPGVRGQEADGPSQKEPGRPGDVHDGREHLAELVTGHPVDLVVVLATQPVVPDPRRVRHGHVDRGLVLPELVGSGLVTG